MDGSLSQLHMSDASRITEPRFEGSYRRGRRGHGRWRRWFLALIMVAAVVVAALHWGDVEKFAELIGKAKPMWLLGALLLQFATYILLSLEWSLVLKSGDSPLSFW